jgi:MFS family permease
VRRERLVPLIVAVALFMENMDANVIATSLPVIARDLGTNPLMMKLAVTSYLLALAVFIPASGWTADRFGARNVFRVAIAVFMAGSLICANAPSLTVFIIGRVVEGAGGAMMAPVARLLLLRTIDKRALVDAMAWLTIPALMGPLLGPPLGGFITTYFSWQWIFLINIPIGVIGIVLITRFIEDVRAETLDPIDLPGLLLSGLAVGGLAFGRSRLRHPAVVRGVSPHCRRRCCGARLFDARAPGGRAGTRFHPDGLALLPRQHHWRLGVPHRRRRDSFPAAAADAAWLRAFAFPVRTGDIRGRDRRGIGEAVRVTPGGGVRLSTSAQP